MKRVVLALLAVLLLGVLAFITSADRSVSWVESTLGSVFQPVQTFAAKASNSIIGFFQRIFKTSDADKELEQLQVRMAQLEQAADENATLKAENERLKKENEKLDSTCRAYHSRDFSNMSAIQQLEQRCLRYEQQLSAIPAGVVARYSQQQRKAQKEVSERNY